MNIDNIKELLRSISRKEMSFIKRAGDLFKGFIKAIKDKNVVAYVRSNPWIITMLTAPIILICAIALIIGTSANTSTSSLQIDDITSEGDLPKTKTVEIYGIKFTVPDSCIIDEENSDQNISIYFQPMDSLGAHDMISVTRFKNVLPEGLSEEDVYYSLSTVSEQLISQATDSAPMTEYKYPVDGFPGYFCKADKEDGSQNYESYHFQINPTDVMFVLYINLPIGGKARPELFQEIIDNVIIDESKHTEPTTSATGNTGGKESSDKPAFTNKYGTPTTICAHKGCNSYIARSGDTNCCEKHSAKCLNCGKYIDEDAMYCMDCLSNAASNTTKKTSYSASDTSNRCQFKDSKGNKSCTNPAMPGSTLCEEHYKYLDDVYHSFAD